MRLRSENRTIRILVLTVAIIAFLAGTCGWYVNDYYKATEEVRALVNDGSTVAVNSAVQSTGDDVNVQIIPIAEGFFFDGPGEGTAIIFYPGAKVEDIAYGNLLYELAAEGLDCFLIHMPGNLAFLGINRADKIMTAYSYEHWYLMGHSLGGAMAAYYAAGQGNNAGKTDAAQSGNAALDGLILLAAYPTKDLPADGFRVLSLYGSEDRVVNKSLLEKGRAHMPEGYTEYCIRGGNHAGFGDYGVQSGDGIATITGSEQKKIAAEEILHFCFE